MNSLVHYKATIKMTTNNELVKFTIPSNLDMNNARFVIGSIAGVLSTGSALIHIQCDELRHCCLYSTKTEQGNLIGRAVLSNTVSINPPLENQLFLGCPINNNIGNNPQLNFSITDVDNLPLTNLTFCEFELIIIGNRLS